MQSQSRASFRSGERLLPRFRVSASRTGVAEMGERAFVPVAATFTSFSKRTCRDDQVTSKTNCKTVCKRKSARHKSQKPPNGGRVEGFGETRIYHRWIQSEQRIGLSQ